MQGQSLRKNSSRHSLSSKQKIFLKEQNKERSTKTEATAETPT